MNPGNTREAKTNLSRLIEDGVRSELLRLGFLAGEILIPDDFDQIGAVEIEEAFAGRP